MATRGILLPYASHLSFFWRWPEPDSIVRQTPVIRPAQVDVRMAGMNHEAVHRVLGLTPIEVSEFDIERQYPVRNIPDMVHRDKAATGKHVLEQQRLVRHDPAASAP